MKVAFILKIYYNLKEILNVEIYNEYTKEEFDINIVEAEEVLFEIEVCDNKRFAATPLLLPTTAPFSLSFSSI
mgnify:CR=1 FL=1